jgi:hypothetical protein
MSEHEFPDQAVCTLAPWKHLLTVPNTIECPSMKIVSAGSEDPVFSGSGQINIRSRTHMDFLMHAVPRNGGEAFKRIGRARENPYNIHDQLGVRATQYDGTEWNAGWTTVHLGDTLGDTWRLSGPIHSLLTDASRLDIAPTSSIEVIYDSRLRVPLPLNMSTSIRRGGKEVLRRFERGGATIDIAGTRIDFLMDPEVDATWAVAATSEDFPHPYAENWVSEPLSLLLGQPVFPRLVARNFGDRSIVWVRPSSDIKSHTFAASILQEDPLAADNRFWEVYRRILTMMVRARDEDGNRNFEAHPLSQYYHEVIQATRGSDWVWCLALASAIEGVTKLLTPENERRSDYAPEAIDELKDHINAWHGDAVLRARVMSSVAYAGTKGVGQILRKFKDEGLIADGHVDAWVAVRNHVMHGELMSPWSHQELEGRMHLLAELMHRLSMRYVEEHSS